MENEIEREQNKAVAVNSEEHGVNKKCLAIVQSLKLMFGRGMKLIYGHWPLKQSVKHLPSWCTFVHRPTRKSPFKITKSFRIYLLCRVGLSRASDLDFHMFLCCDRRLIKPFFVVVAPTSLHAFSRCNIHNLFLCFLYFCIMHENRPLLPGGEVKST
jgi:hypothetical protein